MKKLRGQLPENLFTLFFCVCKKNVSGFGSNRTMKANCIEFQTFDLPFIGYRRTHVEEYPVFVKGLKQENKVNLHHILNLKGGGELSECTIYISG